MDVIEELLERNARYAAEHDSGLPPVPRLQTVVVTCVDQRVDPADVLGLELGDAAVIRTVGGRVTPGVLQNLALLAQVVAANGMTGGFELILMQHTQCGMARLDGPEQRDGLADYLGVPVSELDSKEIKDPHAGVRVDMAELAANPLVPGELSVTGLVYDVGTGRASLVERRAPLREGQ